MKPLPRPVKTLLAEQALDASVMRVWAKVQIKRRVPAPLARPWLVFAGAAALVAFVARVYPPSPPAPAQLVVVGVGPVTDVAAACQPLSGPATPLMHARRPAVPMSRPAGGSAAGAPGETDVVGTLLLGVEDAARDGRTDQVVAVLGEIGEHHADDPRAAEALFMLGSVQLDAMKKPRLAEASFRRALELRPAEDLVPQLWERLQEAEAK